MGGMGSGPASVRQRKETLDDRVCLSVTDMQGRGVFTSQEPVKWSQRAGAGQPVRVVAQAVGGLLVIVTGYLDAQGEVQAPATEVTVSWTDCRFGGRRPWLLCPAWYDEQPCERRVGRLYLSEHGVLMCRRCAGLGYKSDHFNRRERLLHEARKILRGLGGSGVLSEPFPPRPRGMHLETYQVRQGRVRRLLDQYQRLSAGALAAAEARLGQPGSSEKDDGEEEDGEE